MSYALCGGLDGVLKPAQECLSILIGIMQARYECKDERTLWDAERSGDTTGKV
jgi:hypothetical protein